MSSNKKISARLQQMSGRDRKDQLLWWHRQMSETDISHKPCSKLPVSVHHIFVIKCRIYWNKGLIWYLYYGINLVILWFVFYKYWMNQQAKGDILEQINVHIWQNTRDLQITSKRFYSRITCLTKWSCKAFKRCTFWVKTFGGYCDITSFQRAVAAEHIYFLAHSMNVCYGNINN